MAVRRGAMIDRAFHLVGIAAAVVGSLVLLHSVGVAGRPELVSGFTLGACFQRWFAPHSTMVPRVPLGGPCCGVSIMLPSFLLIAGTYSPFLDDATGDPMVDIGYAGVWIVAGAGMLTQLLFRSRLQKRLSVTLYLALGWSVLLVIEPVSTILPSNVL